MSFYSPIDRLAQTLPRPKGTGAEFMTELSKMPGYKAQEAEDRGLQALTNLPKMERAQFLEIMRLAKPAVVPKTGALQTPHHEDYTLPGGSNYREILLTHPNPKAKFQGVPHHFGGVPNILASVRAKDRKGPNGEKILHIEELQSDWHQKGRERGYIGQETPKINEEEHKRALGLQQRDIRGEELTPEERNELEEIRNRHISSIPAVRVPDAPFKKNWHEMALKKMIHHAAKNGYDSIAITPGAEQADRYGLSKHIDSLELFPTLYSNNSKPFVLRGHKNKNQIISKEVSEDDLPELLGNDLAKKLLNAPANHIGTKQLGGVDLETDERAKGMKGFYDKIVPNFLNQFGKKYGAKVGQGQINVDDPNGHSQTEMLRASGIPEQNWGQLTYSQMQKLMEMYSAQQPPKMAPVHYFPITPEMREDVVKNGVPLYAGGGSVEDDEPKKTVKAYKMFRVDKKQPGKLFPLFVDAQTPVDMDKWITAKEGERSTTNTKKVKSKIGDLAYRPGWHAGDLPIATHIGDKDEEQKAEARRVRELRDAYAATMGSTKAAKALARKEHPYPSWVNAPRLRNPNHIWAEVEMPDDVDWQSEATKRGYNDQGKLIASQAHITDQLPLGGHYRYKTNANMLGNWLIGGSMKVKRILHDKEVEAINKAAGAADLPRAKAMNQKSFGFAKGGTVAPDEWMAEEHVNHMADGGPVPPLRPLSPQLAAMREQLAQQAALHKAYNEAMTYVNTNQMPTFAQWVASQGKAKGGLAHMATGGSASAWRNAEPHPENDLLQPIGSSKMVGDEKLLSQDDNFSHGLSEFPSNRKSYRYLYHDEDKNPIGAMQIQTAGPRSKKAVIQNLYVSENNRRQGIASKLLKRARQDFDVKHSTDLTSAGKAFAAVVKAKGGSIKPVGYTKEQVTVSPSLDSMKYELMSVKRYTKKAK